MERLTFEGNFCDIAKCAETPGGSFCEDGACSQRKVWERLKAYEITGMEPCDYAAARAAHDKAERAIADLDEAIKLLGKYAELQKAEQDGRLVVLPCKVGDTVWVINRRLNAVFKNTVIRIGVGNRSDLKNYVKTQWVGPNGNESIRKWSLRQIGRYVFLTQEEAEAALKGGAV